MTTAQNESPEQRARRLNRQKGYNRARRGPPPPKKPKATDEEMREKRYFYMVKWRFGLTKDQWLELFDSQGRACAICESPEPRGKRGWAIDHDHATGQIRGILCIVCNMGIGMLDESTERLLKAIEYLESTPYFNAMIPDPRRFRYRRAHELAAIRDRYEQSERTDDQRDTLTTVEVT